jgi:hypothetical protein
VNVEASAGTPASATMTAKNTQRQHMSRFLPARTRRSPGEYPASHAFERPPYV